MATQLILGATGKTGRRVASILTEHGDIVRRASRKTEPGLIRFDWADPSSWQPALTGVSSLYLVLPDLVEDPTTEVATLLATAVAEGIDRVVLLSSLGAGFAGEPADSGRRRVEEIVRASGLGWTIVRPSGFNQNFSEGFLLPGILNGDVVQSATGNGRVPLIDTQDIAEVVAAALTRSDLANEVLEITGPEALSFAEAVVTISEVSGRTVRHVAISPDEFASNLRAFGVPGDYAAMLVRDQVAIRDGMASTVTDIVERVTGRPARWFADYAKSAAATWRTQ